jgi:uncharacterized membrane protein YeaQ/YmgE (transglycosylase-associated protein family)
MVDMLPDSPAILAIFMLLDSVVGLVIGAVCGWLVSLVSKGHRSKLWHDSVLGILGLLSGIAAVTYMPWHQNTITERLDGGGTVTTTMNSYQHPWRVGIAFAVLLPILYEVYRVRRGRKR